MIVPRRPLLAEPAYRLTQPHSKIRDRFEPAKGALWEPAIIPPANLGQEQFGIPEDSGQGIVELVPEDFPEILFDIGQSLRLAWRWHLHPGGFVTIQEP